eukprot:scaffold846_cov252-Pinguiococcus_pyrenoidosus.AAC.3
MGPSASWPLHVLPECRSRRLSELGTEAPRGKGAKRKASAVQKASAGGSQASTSDERRRTSLIAPEEQTKHSRLARPLLHGRRVSRNGARLRTTYVDALARLWKRASLLWFHQNSEVLMTLLP